MVSRKGFVARHLQPKPRVLAKDAASMGKGIPVGLDAIETKATIGIVQNWVNLSQISSLSCEQSMKSARGFCCAALGRPACSRWQNDPMGGPPYLARWPRKQLSAIAREITAQGNPRGYRVFVIGATQLM